MDNAGYTTLTRQSGLLREMNVVANNIANSATTGFRQEGLVFSEFVQPTGDGPSISMARAGVQNTSMMQGALTETAGTLDFAIEGPGFFMVETPGGTRLTRAGNFALSAQGDLVTNDGFRVLDAGGAPVFVPPDAQDIGIAADGTISSKGQPLSQLGVVVPENPLDLTREDGVRFRTESELLPAENASVLQGFLEGANVDPVSQIARMIEVQRAYEMGQRFLDKEDERIRSALDTLTR